MTADDELLERARRVIPGGVNSPVRAFGAVGGTPVFVASGEGAELVARDGRRFVDYVQSWGALLFGHARSEIVEAVSAAAARGTSFGAPTEPEVELAEAIVRAVPSLEMVRLVNSGTEAAMSAARLARGFTGRTKIVKFAGCYHGHADALLATAGSGLATFGIPGTPGVTDGAAADTVVLPWGDPDALRGAVDVAGDQLAAVFAEPVPANMGVVPPPEGFLEALREVTASIGALLVFDEVITGFRLARGGAQARYGITPDLTVLGKVVGGGFPLAAFGGRAEVMERLAPAGPVYQAGTLSGNPVAVAAGIAALELIERLAPYDALEDTARRVSGGVVAALSDAGVPHSLNRVGSLFSVFFGDGPVRNFDDARAADHGTYARFFAAMLDHGVYLPPSGYEAWFVGTAHDDDVVGRTLDAARDAARAL